MVMVVDVHMVILMTTINDNEDNEDKDEDDDVNDKDILISSSMANTHCSSV